MHAAPPRGRPPVRPGAAGPLLATLDPAPGARRLRLHRDADVQALWLDGPDLTRPQPLRLRLYADGGGRPGALLLDRSLAVADAGGGRGRLPVAPLRLLGGIGYWLELDGADAQAACWRLLGAARRPTAGEAWRVLLGDGLAALLPGRRSWSWQR